jgi:MoaA/NifB/PqqE/SkfB family radical SAM enzyme
MASATGTPETTRAVRNRSETMDLQALKQENSRRLREDWREKREVFQSLPEIVSLNHSNACNLRCVICWHHTGVPIHGVKLRDVERICHQLFPTAQKVILTAAGEPLINDFDEITALARHYQTRIEMYTSCYNMTEDRFRRTRDLFDVLHVSLDCPQKEGYERVRVRSSYERMIENLRMIKRIMDQEGKPFLYCCHAVILKSTVRFLPEFVGFAKDLGFDLLDVQRLHKTHAGLEDEDILTSMPREELDAIIVETVAEARRLKLKVALRTIGYPDFLADPPLRSEEPRLMEYREHGVCWFVGQSLCINHAGEAMACCYPTDIYLGNVLTQPVREIWNGRPMRRLRRRFFARKLGFFCRNCLIVNRDPRNERNFDLYRRASRLRWFEVKKRIAKRLEAAFTD